MSLSSALDRRLHNLHKWLFQEVSDQEQLLLQLYDENNRLRDQLSTAPNTAEDSTDRYTTSVTALKLPKTLSSAALYSSTGSPRRLSHHMSSVDFSNYDDVHFDSDGPAARMTRALSKAALTEMPNENGFSSHSEEDTTKINLDDASHSAHSTGFVDNYDTGSEPTIEDDVPLPPTLPRATPQLKAKRPESLPVMTEDSQLTHSMAKKSTCNSREALDMIKGDTAKLPSAPMDMADEDEASRQPIRLSISSVSSMDTIKAAQRARRGSADRSEQGIGSRESDRLDKMIDEIKRDRSSYSSRGRSSLMKSTSNSASSSSFGSKRGRSSMRGPSAMVFQPYPVWTEDFFTDFDICASVGMGSKGLGSKQLNHMVDDTKFLNLVKEIEGRGEKPWYIISPTSRFCIFWDSLFMIIIAYDFVMVPLQAFDMEEGLFLTVMGWSARLFWTACMPLQIITGYVDSAGNMEFRPKTILRRYVQSWLWLDIIIVGSDWLMLIIGGMDVIGSVNVVKVMRILRVVRVLRLARVFKLPSVLESINTRTYFEKARLVVSILKITVVIIGTSHCIACLWHAVGRGDNSWVERYSFADKSLSYRYAMSLHWSLSQFHGTMEVTPSNEFERWFALIVLAFCFLASAAFVSQITAFLTRLSIISGHQGRMNAVLRQFLEYNHISPTLSLRVTRSATYVLAHFEKNMPEGDVDLLSMIPQPLLVEIHYEVNVPILSEHPFFRRYHHVCPVAVKKICHSAVSRISLSVGDLLFTEGERPPKPMMFFITTGMCIYMKSSGSEVWQVKVGGWACEMCLWTPWTHQGSMRAGAHTNILSVDVEELHSIVRAFSDPVFYAGSYGREVVRQLNGGISGDADMDDLDLSAVQIRPQVDDVNYDTLDIVQIVAKVFPLQLQRTNRVKTRNNLSDRISDVRQSGHAVSKTESISSVASRVTASVAAKSWASFNPFAKNMTQSSNEAMGNVNAAVCMTPKACTSEDDSEEEDVRIRNSASNKVGSLLKRATTTMQTFVGFGSDETSEERQPDDHTHPKIYWKRCLRHSAS